MRDSLPETRRRLLLTLGSIAILAVAAPAGKAGSGLGSHDAPLDNACNQGTIFEHAPPRENAEAEQISLEMLPPFGPLLATDASYERIVRDLELIRAFEPSLADQGHTPAWAPSQIIVQIDPAADLTEYTCLNEFYGVIDKDFLFSFGGLDWYVLRLPGKLNVEALVQQYMHLDAVSFAEPDHLVGGQNYWIPSLMVSGNWRWEIDDGWHDCFDGCDCHRYWVFETDDEGNVLLISVMEQGLPWCEFKK